MTVERDRGHAQAMEARHSREVIQVTKAELDKLRVLLDNFRDVNKGTVVVGERRERVSKEILIVNLDDVDYVLGYLEGLCK